VGGIEFCGTVLTSLMMNDEEENERYSNFYTKRTRPDEEINTSYIICLDGSLSVVDQTVQRLNQRFICRVYVSWVLV
jgi:hypothetical protein